MGHPVGFVAATMMPFSRRSPHSISGKPETFDFLGFTHICGKSRRGGFLLTRKSRRNRIRAKRQAINEELRQVVAGFFNYHAVPTNSRALTAFRYHVMVSWLRALRRRSQRHRLSWDRMTKLVADTLPRPAILHPWPNVRFAVTHPR
jgi:hypothetical protein